MFDISGRRALVTGASSGLGAHFARTLATAGANVTLLARRADRLDGVASSIRQAGGQCDTLVASLADPCLPAVIEEAMRDIDIVVNNAGLVREAAALETSDEDWNEVIATNLTGMFRVSRTAAKAMRDRGRGGSIINIASILGLRQGGNVMSYAVSKAGVIQLTKTLALELARYGIRVNALAPGYVDTELNAAFWETDAGRALVRRIPQRRRADLRELDGPLLLLASEASSYMTGSVVTVDGGHLVSSL